MNNNMQIIHNPKQINRLVIFDATCGTVEGHNYDSINDFARFFTDDCQYNCEIWIANTNENWPTIPYPVKRHIPWLFEFFWKTPATDTISRLHRTLFRTVGPRHVNFLSRILDTILLLFGSFYAKIQIEKILRAILNDDPQILIFPNVDYYSLRALASLAQSGNIPKSTRIIICMIGVMEYPIMRPKYINVTVQLLRRIIKLHNNLVLAAETEMYASFLTRRIQLPKRVHVVSIPKTSLSVAQTLQINIRKRSATETDRKKGVVILCPGRARKDKGYFQLLEIARFLKREFGNYLSIAAQKMDEEHLQYDNAYDADLMAQSNIMLLPSVVPPAEYKTLMETADIILLPYEPSAYVFRGSAVFSDAIANAHPILSTRKTAIGKTIETYRLGFTYESPREIIVALHRIFNMSNSERDSLITRQRTFIEANCAAVRGIVN